MRARLVASCVCALLGSVPIFAAAPAMPGVNGTIQAAIDARDVAGAVTVVVTKDGIVHLDARGFADLAARKPMAADHLFWIASMTKPLTAAAVLMLQDEGKLDVAAPVSRYLPEFAALKAPSGQPAIVTLAQLLTHTSGLADATDAGVLNAHTLAELVPLYLAAPMNFEPGARWKFCQSGINTAARVVEVVSGMSFEKFLQTRLLDPLGMKHTTFRRTAESSAQLATAYAKNVTSGDLEPVPPRPDVGGADRPAFGNMGLYSTGPDYARFCQMLLGGGVLEGKRFLSPAAIKLLTTVQTGDLPTGFFQGANTGSRGANYGWGLGTCILKTPHDGVAAMLSPGSYGHGGGWGTQAWIDPVRGAAYILMVQRSNFGNSDNSPLRRTFQQAAADALAKPPAPAPNVHVAGADWPAYFGDTNGSHYSTLAQITPKNVAQLQPAWTYRTGDAAANNRSQIQCNPLVIDGVLYGTSPQLKLFALEAATGRELWRFDPFGTANLPGGTGLNRGLAWWQEGGERRLMFSAGQYLHAIDPATGKLIDTFGEHGRVDLIQGLDRDAHGLYLAANTPGAVFRDLIIIPMRLGEGPGPAAPGHIRAYDVRTGERRWIFHTIPHPGEKGHETWAPDSWQKTGGANCWAGLVIDHERGLAFVPTGSATFDFWGGDRVGDNLYANCLLALDAATGARKWHFQFTHHDIWDRDPPAAPVLCEVERDGKKIAAVAQVTKSAHVWVFNRDTGESLFPWREEPLPASLLDGEHSSPTQPLPLKPAPFARQVFTEAEVTNRTPAAHDAVLARLHALNPHRPFDPPSERGSIILPGLDGGAEWGGAAVDPRGVLYINSSEMPWVLTMVRAKSVEKSGASAALYSQLCISCHGAKGEGNAAQNIPRLVDLAPRLKADDIAALFAKGRGVMPSFAFVPEEQRRALASYVLAAEFNATNTKLSKDEPTGPKNRRSPYTLNGYKRLLDPDGFSALRPPYGTLNALDLNTGEYLWKKTLGETPNPDGTGPLPTGAENYGGPVVTAGGVLFIAATSDEKFRAFDAKTGELLWQTTLPAGGYATPATYSIDGRQFVVMACGGGKMGTKSGDAYLAFTLPPASEKNDRARE